MVYVEVAMNELVKDLFNIVVLFCVVWIGFYLYTRHDTIERRTDRYECSLTEFVADVPQDVRNECRRRRIESINNRKD